MNDSVEVEEEEDDDIFFDSDDFDSDFFDDECEEVLEEPPTIFEMNACPSGDSGSIPMTSRMSA